MKKFRKLIVACSVLALGFGFAGVANWQDTVSASAETVISYEVSDGADVRIETGSNGIRFTTKISYGYYAQLQETYPTGEFTFYTKINRAEDPVETDAYIYTHSVTESSFVDGFATYYSAIVYDKLTTDELKAASGMDLTAEAFVDITEEGKDTVTLPADATSTRSMRTVANLALLSGKYANDATTTAQLEKFLGDVTRNEGVAYFETSATTKTITLAGATEGMDVYFNGVKTVLTTGANGVVDYSSLKFSEYTLGDYLYVSAFNDDNDVVSAKARYVTQAIETEEELRESLNSIRNANFEGQYYVLADNIDCTDTTLLGGTQAWGNLKSIFDGQGYYVNNLYVGVWGIFGANINGGTLKNISFTNVNSTEDNPVLFGTGGAANIQGQVSNVYVSSACVGLTLYQTAHKSFSSWGYFNAVILENCAGVFAGNSSATQTLSTNSLYMISETETPVAADRYATNTKIEGVNKYEYYETGKYGGMYWYASYDLMKAEVKATAIASQPTIAPFNDCWDLTEGYPVWKNLPAKVTTITAKQYVEQPSSEYGTATAAGYSALALSGVQDETVSVSINGGEATSMNVSNGSVQIAWTAFANAGVALGQTVPMLVKSSDGTTWIFNEVMYVTQAIDSETEFRAVCNDLRNKNYANMYYVLADNIDCTDTTLLGGTQAWGNLKSIFDGQGYYVNNLYVGVWGIFGANINGGTLKNISFTNVNSTEDNPVLFGTGGAANIQGQVSNVYVSSACVGLTLYQTAHKSFSSWGYFNAVILENCAGVFAGNSSATQTLSTNSLYMISETETPVAADRYATNTKIEGVNKYEYYETGKYGGMYWYASYDLMKAEVKATAIASQPTIAPFNDCWDLTKGYPVWKNLPKV